MFNNPTDFYDDIDITRGTSPIADLDYDEVSLNLEVNSINKDFIQDTTNLLLPFEEPQLTQPENNAVTITRKARREQMVFKPFQSLLSTELTVDCLKKYVGKRTTTSQFSFF